MINFNPYTSNHYTINQKVSHLRNNQATQNDCKNILYLIRNHKKYLICLHYGL